MTDLHNTGDLDHILYQERPSRLAMLGCLVMALVPGLICLALAAWAAWG